MLNPLSSYHPDAQPLARINGYPIYLSTAIVGVLSVMMVVCAFGGSAVMERLGFFPGLPDTEWELWRWVSYPAVALPSIWFVIEMFLLFRFGGELERIFGRKAFIRLMAGLVLMPPLLLTLANWALPPALWSAASRMRPLAGTEMSGFCVFLGFALLYPGAVFFSSLPWLTAKVVAPIFLVIQVLQFIARGDRAGLVLFLANCVLTYAVLRHAGLSPRFEAITGALREAMPQRLALPGAAQSPSQANLPGSPRRRVVADKSPAGTYQPKIKPREDLYPEKKAVREIDQLLDKIGREGLASLTPEEREALQRASAKLKEE